MYNHEWRRELFNSGELHKVHPETGYAERPVSWFEENIIPDLLIQKAAFNLQSALEVGCAMGYYSKVLAKHFLDVLAIDFSPPRIEQANQVNAAPNITYKLVDIVNESIPDVVSPFDFGISSAVYQHIDPTNGDRVKAFEHTFDAIKSQGHLFLYDERFDMRPEPWGGFYEPLKPEWITENLNDVCSLISCDFMARGLHGEHEFRWILKKK